MQKKNSGTQSAPTYYILFLVLFFLSGFPLKSFSQCSVCAAQVETNVHEGKDQAKGLNTGILYLMSAPYLLVAGVGYVWYKNYKKKNVLVEMKDDDINLN